jgi:ABC-type ATPase involved in cell division
LFSAWSVAVGTSCCSEELSTVVSDTQSWICFTKSVSEPPPVYIGDELVERVDKLLGMGLQNNLKWNNHVGTIIQKANRQVYILRECRKANLSMEVGITLYKSNIRSILETFLARASALI